SPDEIKVFPTLQPIVGKDQDEVRERYEYIKNLVTIEEALAYLGRYFDHHDFSQYDVDAPFPELGDIGKKSFQSTNKEIKKRAKANTLTLRQVDTEETSRERPFLGTYEEVADQIIEWVDNKCADGFVRSPHVLGYFFHDIIERVIPILAAKG